MRKQLSIALVILPLVLIAADKPPATDPPKIPTDLQLAVEKKINQSLQLQLQMEQARREYEQLVEKMRSVCAAEKSFTVQRTQAGDWLCVPRADEHAAALPGVPTRPASVLHPTKPPK